MGKSLDDRLFVEEVINSLTHFRGLQIEPLRLEDFTKALVLMREFGLDYEDSAPSCSGKKRG